MNKIELLVEEYNQARKELTDKIKKAFKDVLDEFFEKNEGVTGIVWSQYTPYFNDGDECDFSRHDFYFTDKDKEFFLDNLDGLAYGDNSEATWDNPKLYSDISKTLGTIPDEIYKDVFGDHVVIGIFRDGTVTVNEYDHD